MARITVTGDAFHLSLSGWERVLGLLKPLDVPLSAVTGVELLDDPIREVHGVKAGMGLPSRKIGTWVSPGRRTIAVVQRGRPGLKISVQGRRFDDLVVSQPGAEAIAAQLRAAG